MLPTEIEQQLSQIEDQCEALAAAVVDGEPQALEALTTRFRQAALDLTRSVEASDLDRADVHDFKLRLKKLALSVAIHRGSLARQAALTERALHALVPATQEQTYASGPYGGAARQSGAFKVLTA